MQQSHAIKFKDLGVIQLQGDYWIGRSDGFKIYVCAEEQKEAEGTDAEPLGLALYDLFELASKIVKNDFTLRSRAASEMWMCVAGWHHEDEGEITEKSLLSKMSASSIFLCNETGYAVEYAVESIPSPYMLTVQVDRHASYLSATAN
ncbi:hypothetical protein [Pseudoxanthomonas kalamensis]|uniref:hypothetical protein n=1 Tax=Pseudoxanthomonas kalamensis TaxID=289483 RepID=UPI001390DBA8|nr:hypothetical protein [Pseudoxanthomonas kalamensis]